MSLTIRLSLCFAIKEYSRQAVGDCVLQLFPSCIDSIARSVALGDEVEIVVADFQSKDWPLAKWLPHRAPPARFRLVTLEDPFSLGRGKNAAARHASYSTLFFLDGDMLVNRELLEAAYANVQAGNVFVPVCQDLNENGAVFRERHDGFGVLAVSKRLFDNIGGWPEFTSWGGEDTILFERLRRNHPVVRHAVPGFLHQWHPEGAWKERFYLRPADVDYFEYVHSNYDGH